MQWQLAAAAVKEIWSYEILSLRNPDFVSGRKGTKVRTREQTILYRGYTIKLNE